MNKNKTNAKISGYSLILMALIAGFVFGFAFPKIYDKTQLELAAKNFSENYELYKQMLMGIFFIIVLDILVSWTLYQFFKGVHKKIALTSFVLRIIYTLIFVIATYYLVANLEQGIDNNHLLKNYNLFEKVWSMGLIIFGGHLLAIGVLMKLYKNIPIVLWILTLIAGVAYITVHLLKIILPQLNEFTQILNNILALPMALGEICLAIWLIMRGGKQYEIKNTGH